MTDARVRTSSTEGLHDTKTGANARLELTEDARVGVWTAVLLFALLTAVMTWPQVVRPGSVPDNSDSYFSMWRLSWLAHQLPSHPLRLFDANIFHPRSYTFAYSDAVLFEGLLGAPLVWLGVPVVYVYNLLVFSSFVLCAAAAFVLVRDLTGRADAAIVAGIVFAFAPFRFDHYFHLELLWAPWIPLALWKLHHSVNSGRLRDGIWFGVFLALQGLSCIYYTVFLVTILVVLAPVLLLGRSWPERQRILTSLAAGGLLAAAILLPYALAYIHASRIIGERGAGEAALYAAGPKHYLASMPQSLLYGRLTGPLGRHEKRLFPGFAVLALAVIGLWPPVDRKRLAYALVVAVAVDISFGFRGLLYGWLRDHVMLYRGLRVPARLGQMVLLALGVLAGFGVARVVPWLSARNRTWARAAVPVVCAVIVLEYASLPMALIAVDTTPPPVYRWLNEQPPGVVAELPMPSLRHVLPFHDAEYQYFSTFHWHPLLNGYSGMFPASYNDLIALVEGRPDDTAIAALRARGATYLIVHERHYGRQEYAAITSLLDGRADLVAFESFADGPFSVRAYRLLAESRGDGSTH